MKITEPVRVLKGQQVLPDGSILEDNQITDGSTINIVIEPAKDIALSTVMGPLITTHKVNNSMLLCDLKQLLVDNGVVAWALDEFQLLISSNDDDENDDDRIYYDIHPCDELLPLHLCGMVNKTTLKIFGRNITIQLIGQNGQCWHKTFSRNMKIREMKQVIHSFQWLFHPCDTAAKFRAGVILFLQTGNGYRKLEGEAPIGSVLSENDGVHFLEDRFFHNENVVPVHFGHSEGQKIGWVGCVQGDTVLGIKLRVQHQMGLPVNRIDVKRRGGTPRNYSKPDAITVS